MKIAVIDDEPYSREELIHQIVQVEPQARIVEAGSGVEAVELMEREQFDILFVDIHLCDMMGTTIASLARKLMPNAQIIFATAYPEYGVKAFELGVDNYILKPFDPRRVREVLERCRAAMAPKETASPYLGRISVTVNRHTILLAAEDIVYIETAGNGRQCILHIADKAHLTATPLSTYERELSGAGFFRIHKTCLVQLRLIQDIFPWSSNSFALHMRGFSAVLPIGREKIKELRRLLTM